MRVPSPALIAALTAGVLSLGGIEAASARTPVALPIESESPAEDFPATAAKPIDQIASCDTVWIADWSFEAPNGSCDATGWTHLDNRVRNDGSNYWQVGNRFNGTGGITGNAAILSKHDLAWAVHDGYGNDWDYSIILKYQGTGSTLSFKFLSDSEPGFDFFKVEADSGGVSELRVNYAVNPEANSSAPYRTQLLSYSGVQSGGTVTGLALPDFGVPAVTHEVYLRFVSDDGYSDEDGSYPSSWGAGLVVDNIVVTGGLAYAENFEGALDPNVTFANTANAVAFGTWARLYHHISDNDRCAENTTCAWLWSDPTLPARYPDMAFGPGGAVIHNWLDEVLLSPWVSLGSSTGIVGTTLSWRRNASQRSSQSLIAQNWSIRTKRRIDNTDTSTLGDSIDCVTPWSHASSWNTFNSFTWGTNIWDLSTYMATGSTEIQLRIRVADTQLSYLFGDPPPATWNPGPGPYIDRIRIGRRVYTGPEIADIFYGEHLAQDAFPSVAVTNPCGFGPTITYVSGTDRFGTCDFSRAAVTSGGTPGAPCSARCDSMAIYIYDRRGAGIASTSMYGAIVAGPHAGKAPPPWTVGANGFFQVPVRRGTSCGSQAGSQLYVVDLDDEYFRGGDVLLYCFTATDGLGGFASYPVGLTGAPTSIASAEAATGGLLEVSFLPQIDWDPAYLARIAADPNGKLTPTPAEVANSNQRSCILYVNQTEGVPRSKPLRRTDFEATLDRLGYAGYYDVYDMNFWGNSTCNNQLAGRATVQEALGYSLIVHDTARYASHTTLPIGNRVEGLFPQTQWYRDWLAQAPLGAASRATLWLIGDNVADATDRTNPLLYGDMGVTFVNTSQPVGALSVVGETAMVWEDSSATDFNGDSFALTPPGACPSGTNSYDGLGAAGTAVRTHRHYSGATPGAGAMVANANPAAGWNSLLMSFSWGDIRDPQGSAPGAQEDELAGSILNVVLPPACRRGPQPTDVAGEATPRATRLYQNVPNPFNPVTTIVFDLQHRGNVQLQIFDVSGRRVRTLVDGPVDAGWKHKVTWNGMDDAGRPVAGGVYLYRLITDDTRIGRKMVVVR